MQSLDIYRANWPSLFPEADLGHYVLRELTLRDTADLYHLLADREVTEFLGLSIREQPEEALGMIKKWSYEYREKMGIRWAVSPKETNDLIGMVGLRHLNQEHMRAELSYALMPAYWRRGIMYNTLKEVVNFSFSTLGLHRLEAYVYSENYPSSALLEKLGFRQEGLLQDYFFYRRRFHNAYVYALLQS